MRRYLAALTLAAGLATSTARATWSMIIIDTRTGEVAVGSCTCLTSLDLQALTPVLITGVGAAAAQSATDSAGLNRTFIRDHLISGTSPDDILAGLSDFDADHQSRQYGIADVQGRAATFTGNEDGQWAGGQTGRFDYTYAGHTGTIVYAVQGNVLTGAPVVQAAVDALHNTAGDLPARFMAAMQAARSMGGDGRCSCPGGVTTCGSPPPTFTKSAHIGYMLVARAGDKDSSTGIYPTGASPSAAAVGDLHQSGRPDVVTLNTSAGTFTRLTNITPPGSAISAFRIEPDIGAPPGARLVAIADMNGDTRPDLISAQFGSVSILPALVGGGFGPRVDTPISDTPQAMTLADADGAHGPDVIVAASTPALNALLNTGGALQAPQTATIGADPRSVACADFNGDGMPDAVVLSRTATSFQLFTGNGAGVFSPGPSVTTPAFPTAMAIGDFNHDGRMDVACANQSSPPTITIYFNDGAGAFTLAQTINTPSGLFPSDMKAGDMDGDGNTDLVVVTSTTKLFVLRANGAGAFTAGPVTDLQFPVPKVTLADLNGDGRPELIIPSGTGASAAIVTPRANGSLPTIAGTASGDYFLTLDVPNAHAADADPVIQLQSQFNTWRTARTGRPDAVQSSTSGPQLSNADPNRATGTMTISLADWRGLPISVPITSITVSVAPDGAGAVAVGAAIDQGQGVYQLPLSVVNHRAGTDHLLVTIDDGVRKVVLMPAPEVVVARCPADFDGDGEVGTDADIEAFFACLGGDCCQTCASMDVNQDGDTGTDADIEAFFRALGLPCNP